MKEDHEYSLESENMEEHKSLILHLLSKLKLGMDLTKVLRALVLCSHKSFCTKTALDESFSIEFSSKLFLL